MKKFLTGLLMLCMMITTCFFIASCKNDEEEIAEITNATLQNLKTSFIYGEEFSLGSNFSVTAIYDDDSQATVPSTAYEIDSSAYLRYTAGQYTIVVSIDYEDVQLTKNYTVTVAERTISSISVNNPQELYSIGDSFNSSVGTVTVTYAEADEESSYTETINLSNSNIAVTGFNSSSLASAQIITVTYKTNYSDTFAIDVYTDVFTSTTAVNDMLSTVSASTSGDIFYVQDADYSITTSLELPEGVLLIVDENSSMTALTTEILLKGDVRFYGKFIQGADVVISNETSDSPAILLGEDGYVEITANLISNYGYMNFSLYGTSTINAFQVNGNYEGSNNVNGYPVIGAGDRIIFASTANVTITMLRLLPNALLIIEEGATLDASSGQIIVYNTPATLPATAGIYYATTSTFATFTKYTEPTEFETLTASVGDTLADIALPYGWYFVEDLTTSVGTAGQNTFHVYSDKFIYDYTGDSIEITITVS